MSTPDETCALPVAMLILAAVAGSALALGALFGPLVLHAWRYARG